MENHKRYYFIGLLLAIAFVVGFQFGGGKVKISGSSEGATRFIEINREKAPQTVDWQILWDTIETLNQKYVDRPVDMLEVLYGAARGAVSSLGDPYTTFLPPREAEDFQDELSGNFEGIGAEIAVKNGRLTVVAPLPGSPAERTGLKAGDFIFKVNGEETREMTIEEAVSKIRGPAGSEVVLSVFRNDETEAREISITRAEITVQSVESEVREVGDQRIGYIKMRRFGADNQQIMEGIISDFLLSDAQGIILDLRNNPGGFLETAVQIASNWVADGQPVVTQRYSDRPDQVFRASGPSRLSSFPTVVLINGGSASASEIVAGALRDHDEATLVGEQSFGKGSIQELIDLRGGADLKLTIAKWLTPSGHDLNEEGLTPDVVVELTEEDFDQSLDPQLDRALELLTE